MRRHGRPPPPLPGFHQVLNGLFAQVALGHPLGRTIVARGMEDLAVGIRPDIRFRPIDVFQLLQILGDKETLMPYFRIVAAFLLIPCM